MAGQIDLQQAIRKAQLRIEIRYALYKTTKMSNNMPKAGIFASQVSDSLALIYPLADLVGSPLPSSVR